MPAAKKSSKVSSGASRSKTVKAKTSVPKVKAGAPVRQGKAKLTLVGNAPPIGKRVAKGGAPKTKVQKVAAPPGTNVILELWKAKEEKRRNEAGHTKFHQTGPPTNSHASHPKHDRFAQHLGRRKV